MKRSKLLIQTSANGYWAIVDEAGRALVTASMVEFPTEKDVEKYLMSVAMEADRRYRMAMEADRWYRMAMEEKEDGGRRWTQYEW